jgi:hypothetical protein
VAGKNLPLVCRIYRLRKKACSEDREGPTGLLIKKYLTICGLSASILSIMLLLVMYFSSKLLRNQPGKILICLSLALMCSQVFFLLATFGGARPLNRCEKNEVLENSFPSREALLQKINDHLGCFIYGLLSHYFHLAFFAWSFTMAYDMFSVFTALTSKSDKSPNKKSNLRMNDQSHKSSGGLFRKYLLYGWTGPFLVVSLLFATQFLSNGGNYRMAYGFGVCFISQQIDLAAFFVLPVLCVLLANFYFLVGSIRSIRSVDRMSKKYLQKDEVTTSSGSANRSKRLSK